MIATFWGVRGSQATPGATTVRYGGNTSCVSLDIGVSTLVLDAGTGIRGLGQALAGGDQEVLLLVSHLHYDHICGFPLFEPLHEPGRKVYLFDYDHRGSPWTLLNLLDGVHFPMVPEHLACACTRVDAYDPAFLRQRGLTLHHIPANHPGGAVGFRVEHHGRSFVYIPDNELGATAPETPFEELVAFCRGADVLCHDAQYRRGELVGRHGWGHSSIQQVCELAAAAQVRHLVLFHHDPDRTDEALYALEQRARATLTPHGIAATAAYEGLTLDLARQSVQAAPSL